MEKRLKLLKSESEGIMLFLVVVLSVFRFSYFGFSYAPYLDDYVQYLYYPSFQNPWKTVLLGGATILSTRPLAGLFDFFVWSNLSENLGAAVFVLSLLYGLSGVFFYKALKKFGLNVGPVFLAVYLFLPLNTEGTFWVSASSRIAASLFLVALALWAAANDKTFWFCVFNFLSVWFYEQTAALSVFAGVLAGVLKKSRKVTIVSIFSGLSVAVFYLKFGAFGENADRMKVAEIGDVLWNLSRVLRDFAEILGRINFKIIFNGFLRGFRIVASDFSVVWIFLLAIFCMLFANLSGFGGKEYGKTKKEPILGAALVLVSLLPFVAAKNSVLNLRNIVPALLGIGLISDSILERVFKKYSHFFAAALIFCFSVAAVSETWDYGYTAREDQKASLEIAKMVGPETKKIRATVDLPKYYPQNAPYNDHIMSVFSSDWGPSGVVRTISKNHQVVVEVARE